MKTMDKLKELTAGLPNLVQSSDNGITQYKTIKGTAIGFGLMNESHVAVQRFFMSKGTIFPSHTHPENEVIVVYIGQFEHTVDCKTIILKTGESYHIPPNICHSGIALEDTWMIAITVPGGKGYADVEGDNND